MINKTTRLLVATVLLTLCLYACCAASTIGSARHSAADGTLVSFGPVCVTAVFPDELYVQSLEGGQGICVRPSAAVAPGDVVTLTGVIHTDPLTLERYVVPNPRYPNLTGEKRALRPVHLKLDAVTGSGLGLQAGVPGSIHLNNVGLLASISGKVQSIGSGPGKRHFFLGGGSDPLVKVIIPAAASLNEDFTFVTATGVVSLEPGGSNILRVLKVTTASNITGIGSWVSEKIAAMSLDQKIGQLFQVRVNDDEMTSAIQTLLETYKPGGVVYFQYNGNLDDPASTANFSNALQQIARSPAGGGIPYLISLDQEGGRVTRITGGAEGPGNMGLGAARNPSFSESIGRIFGREIISIGANADLAPVLDVNNNPANPVIGVRSFGESPSLAGTLGAAYTAGLHSQGVVATGKHFPGHGDTNVDSHSGLPVVTYDYNTLDTIHGEPFRKAIAGGMDAIMTAHIVVTCLDPVRPATLSPQVIDGYLRGTLGFQGVVMTDSMGMAGVNAQYGPAQASVLAIKAGVDLLSLSPDLAAAIAGVKAAVQSGDIPMSRIDESVGRVLRLKRRWGIIDAPPADPAAAAAVVGCAEHREVEFAAAAAAVTLVQNNNWTLPITPTPDQSILLICVESSETTTDACDRFAAQLLTRHPSVQQFPISASPSSSTRTSAVNAARKNDIVIVGTSRADLAANSGQVALVNALLDLDKPVVVVGLREPYELAVFPNADAYVAAYNYRSCGFAAVVATLFGDIAPTGLLPVSIPGYYPFGHGLTW